MRLRVLSIAAIVVGAVSVSSPSVASNDLSTMYGRGNDTCREFMGMGELDTALDLQWVLGYVSAGNFYWDGKYKAVQISTIKNTLVAYCREQPGQELSQAAAEIVKRMRVPNQ